VGKEDVTLKIVFVYNLKTSWTEKDLKILASRHEVKEIYFKKRIQDLFMIIKCVWWSELVFCWLGNGTTFLGMVFKKLFRKNGIVIAGGDDVVNMPEINYGAMRKGIKNRIRRWVCRSAFRYSDRVLAVSKATLNDAIKNAHVNPTKVFLLYHGFKVMDDSSVLNKRDDLVITVGAVTRDHLKRKGLETFVKSAFYIPNVLFVLIGAWRDDSVCYLKKIAPPNVKFTGYIAESELDRYMKKAKVFVQVSAHEGFGASLTEAMLYGCIPVVTNRYAIPEVVGDCGIYVPYNNPKATAKAIQKALGEDSDFGEFARERIKELFPLEKRRMGLIDHVKQVAKDEARGSYR